jgi:hypothetical protein
MCSQKVENAISEATFAISEKKTFQRGVVMPLDPSKECSVSRHHFLVSHFIATYV